MPFVYISSFSRSDIRRQAIIGSQSDFNRFSANAFYTENTKWQFDKCFLGAWHFGFMNLKQREREKNKPALKRLSADKISIILNVNVYEISYS